MAVNDTYTVTEDGSVVLNPLANDSELDGYDLYQDVNSAAKLYIQTAIDDNVI